MSPYEALADLAKHELALVDAGEVEELPALHARRDALIAALPAVPPAEARSSLERAAAFQTRVTAVLASRLRESGAELRKLTHGRTAMAGYAPQDERLKLVDRAG